MKPYKLDLDFNLHIMTNDMLYLSMLNEMGWFIKYDVIMCVECLLLSSLIKLKHLVLVPMVDTKLISKLCN